MKRPEHEGFVYFIQCKSELGAIKIGWAQNVKKRLKALQTACPHELEVIAYYGPTYREAEIETHELFAKHRLRGEWFYPHDELLKFIREDCKDASDSLVAPAVCVVAKNKAYVLWDQESETVLAVVGNEPKAIEMWREANRIPLSDALEIFKDETMSLLTGKFIPTRVQYHSDPRADMATMGAIMMYRQVSGAY